MHEPLVSIVINNYNYARFLPAAVESAINQTYPKIEVIVVDDGSTDDSRAIIESFGNRIRPILKENGGQASAFNAGIAVARGDLVAFLDADDYFVPNKVERLVAAHLSNPQAVMLYHQVQQVESTGVAFGTPIPAYGIQGSIEQVMRSSGGWFSFPPTSGLAFSRTYVERIFPIPTHDLTICADGYLYDVAGFIGSVIFLPEPLTAYRIHGNNLWNNDEHREGRMHERMLRRFEIRNQQLNQFLIANRLPPVDLSRSFVYRLQKWKTNAMPFIELPMLMLMALRFASFNPRQRISTTIRLPLQWIRSRVRN